MSLQHTARTLFPRTDRAPSAGEVWLAGAGPGDPELLTLRALRRLQEADVVLHDALVSDEIMALVHPDAQRLYVGKRRAEHAVPQEGINGLLIERAMAGQRVLRLKGGDPFIFGRGGEEIARLAEHGIRFEVIPGITAASGCASYAGIPLTHRDHAQSCLFVTGNRKDGSVELDWPALVHRAQTVVVYMGLVGLPTLCERLIEHGLPPTHPAALIARGTRAEQVVIAATLATLAGRVAAAQVAAPTLIIVGEVVRLHASLAWFEP